MRKNTHFRRILSVALTGTLLAGLLAGCGSKKSDAGLSPYVYVPTYIDLPKEVTEVMAPTLAGDTVYFSMNAYVHADGTPATADEVAGTDGTVSGTDIGGDAEGLQSRIQLYSIKRDGTGFTKLSDYQQKQVPTNDYAYANLDRMVVDEAGNIWIVEEFTQSIYDLPAGFDMNSQDPSDYYQGEDRHIYIRKLSSTGKELSCTDFVELAAGDAASGADPENNYISVSDMCIGKGGNIYIADNNSSQIYGIGSDGKLVCKLSAENAYIGNIMTLKDGSTGVLLTSDDGKDSVKMINAAGNAWGEEKALSVNVWNASAGGKDYDFCYNEGTTFYGYKFASNTNESILTWINCDVDSSSLSFATMLDDGDVFAIVGGIGGDLEYAAMSSTAEMDGPDDSGYQFVLLKKTARKDVKQKTTLTLATMYLDYNIRKEILAFNKSSDSTRIEVKDYSEFNTSDDYNAGITKLSTEMVSGNIPDLIDVSELPYRQYAAKGLLEDLYPYIDKDSSYKRDAFVPSILKASEMDGKLYILPSNFFIITIAGSAKTLGPDMGWTMEEMQNTIKAHPEADYPFGAYMTRKDILETLCMLNMDNYIDWQTGKCSFDSDDFKKLLAFANSFPENMPDMDNEENAQLFDEAAMIRDGRQLMTFTSVSDFDYFQQLKYQFGGDIVFKGMPASDRKGNIAMLRGGLSMTTSCKDKDAAWQFIRRILAEDYQQKSIWNLPILQKAYDAKLAQAMEQEYETDVNGQQVPMPRGYYTGPDGQETKYYALTQAEADQIKAVVDSAVHTVSYDPSVTDIINEEAAYYFKGEKTVDQTAAIIQSRMNVFVNEQK
ncbi:MAG: ABC transporter substrate-binding protein [Oscillospiraceae bacterium]|jgi:ABC-type glycerol-3-phosphate transport system substrate-binding protein